MGSRPDPGFARRGGAAPYPESFGFGLATPSQPGRAFERGTGPAFKGVGPDPKRVAFLPHPDFVR